MAVFTEPTKWATTLGKDADVVSIPDTAGDTDPSIDKIFPSVFSIPLAQGGRAIPRSVLNGLFKLLGDWIFYAQNGGIASYSASFDYAVGSVVKYNNQIYICVQTNGASSTIKAPTDSAYWFAFTTNPINSDLIFNNALRIMRKDSDKYIIVEAGDDSSTASSITVSGVNRTGQEGTIILISRDSNNHSSIVTLFPDGTFSLNGNKIITQPDINLKADKDFSNIDNTAKIAIAHNAMPSNVYDDLTIGASGTLYTAPADGYAIAQGNVDVNSLWSFVDLSCANGVYSRCLASTGSLGMKVFTPLRKGQQFSFNYQNATNLILRYRYAVGSESEQ